MYILKSDTRTLAFPFLHHSTISLDQIDVTIGGIIQVFFLLRCGNAFFFISPNFLELEG